MMRGSFGTSERNRGDRTRCTGSNFRVAMRATHSAMAGSWSPREPQARTSAVRGIMLIVFLETKKFSKEQASGGCGAVR